MGLMTVICSIIAVICIIRIIMIGCETVGIGGDGGNNMAAAGLILGLNLLFGLVALARIGFYVAILIIDVLLYGGLYWW